ncbi:rothmund-thomson syndrome DNA helicase recq4, putative, partial [Ixodes scapularis]
NFVRIDLKRKRFSRGHHKLNVRKLKFKEWKQRKNGAAKGNTHQPGGTFRTGSSGKATSTCFKCGLLGHWARSCPGNAGMFFKLYSVLNEQEVFHLPTLEEAAEMARGVKLQGDQSATPTQVFNDTTLDQGASGTDDVTPTQSQAFHSENASSTVQPLLEVSVEGKLPDTPEFVFKTLHKMGFSKFRPGQEAAIMRILSGMSTLLVSSTGSGKSLCYQIPAYLYAQERECITLVVSPLISLMEDQVSRIERRDFGYHGDLQHPVTTGTLGKCPLDILIRSLSFILAWAHIYCKCNILSSENGTKHGPWLDLCFSSFYFPPIFLLQILTTKLKVRCILALTATATRSTCLSIAEHLCIEDCTSGIIGTPAIPDNLVLSISEEEYRDEALIALLKGSRLGSCESIIVYCTRREETERLASLIRTSLQSHEKHPEEEKNPKGKTNCRRRSYLAWDAEAYHAGLTSFRRRSIQKKHFRSTCKLRVVVATVAFGMGIDKADIRAIIHYNMPKSFESYVQEAGRAGRDGLTSHCHLFLEPEGRDQYELKRHIYANSTDRHVIRKLLKKIFSPLTCQQGTSNDVSFPLFLPFSTEALPVLSQRHCVAIPIDATVEELDMKEENILTLLCFLEFHPKKVVQVFNKVYATCTLKCYGGPQQLRSVASKNAPVAAAMALARQKGEYDEDSNSLSFAVVDVASYMGWDSKLVKKDLKNLEWDNSLKSGVIVEFSDLSFHLSVAADLSEEDRDDLLDYLYNRVNKQERMELQRLKQVHAAFQSVAYQGYFECVDDISTKKSDSLKQLIHQYFNEELDPSEAEEDNSPPSVSSGGLHCAINLDIVVSLQRDIRSLVGTHRDHTFNGRAVARIFHGIASPCFPAQVWGRVHRFWRSNLDIDFNAIVRIANRELVSFR